MPLGASPAMIRTGTSPPDRSICSVSARSERMIAGKPPTPALRASRIGLAWSGVHRGGSVASRAFAPAAIVSRSEEHTSELQSLMRISYAVFCLKKKKHHNNIQHHNQQPH